MCSLDTAMCNYYEIKSNDSQLRCLVQVEMTETALALHKWLRNFQGRSGRINYEKILKVLLDVEPSPQCVSSYRDAYIGTFYSKLIL